jgi:iron complex outermembrane receptor protein
MLAMVWMTGLAPRAAADTPAPPARDYQIAAGPLARALNQFGRQAGILLSFPSDLVAPLRSEGLRGRYRVHAGLRALLAGTGLEAVARHGGYLVRPAPDRNVLGPVSVTGRAAAAAVPAMPDYVGGQVAAGGRLGVLGNMDVMDAPFNITGYTARTIESQQARSVADLLVANDPAVRVVGGRGDIVDTFLIRG